MLTLVIGIWMHPVLWRDFLFWAIDKFSPDARLSQLLKLLVVLVCLASIVNRVLPLAGRSVPSLASPFSRHMSPAAVAAAVSSIGAHRQQELLGRQLDAASEASRSGAQYWRLHRFFIACSAPRFDLGMSRASASARKSLSLCGQALPPWEHAHAFRGHHAVALAQRCVVQNDVRLIKSGARLAGAA